MGELVFMDSSALRAILDAQRFFEAEARHLSLANVVGQPRHLLSIVGLLDLIDDARGGTPA